eukprot:gene42160-62736_t
MEERRVKAMFVPAYARFGTLFIVLLGWYLRDGVGDVVEFGLLGSAAAMLLVGLLPSVATDTTPKFVVQRWAVSFAASIFVLDFRNAAALTTRMWPYGLGSVLAQRKPGLEGSGIRKEPQKKTCTLLVCNRRGFLPELDRSPAAAV